MGTVIVATLNVHAYATLGSVHELATAMHTLAQFPNVYVATNEDAPGVLAYIVEDENDDDPPPVDGDGSSEVNLAGSVEP